MAFDLKTWKDSTADKLRGLGGWLKQRKQQDVPCLTYGALCGMSLLPLVEAAQGGQLLPVMMALGGVASSVGGNLVANQIQQWIDTPGAVNEEQVANWVGQQVDNPELVEALDSILEKLDAVDQARSGMNKADQEWFLEALRSESERIGNLSRYRAIVKVDGVIAQGKHVVLANDHSVITGNVGRDVLVTTIEKQVIENQILSLPAQLDSIERVRLRYLKRLWQQCNVLPLAAMGGEQDMGQDVSLDQVYIALDTLTRIVVRDNETKPQAIQLDREEEKPLSALDAATQFPRLVLLGDPGSGKSTFVRQLASRLAAACLGETEPLPGWGNCQLPLLITLRDLSPRLSSLSLDGLSDGEQQQLLADAVHQQWRADLELLGAGDLTNRLEEILAEWSVVLILDGLDEVPASIRLLVRRAVAAVLRAYPNLQRVIVTCRIRSYTGAAVLRDFTTHTLAPFDEEKIRNLIMAWYNAQVCLNRLESGRAGERSRDLIQAALAGQLREMSSNPMLLTTMAIIHQREVGLPRERVRLYAQAVQVLLNRWQKHKGLTITSELGGILNDSLKMRAVLERLGYEAHRIQSIQGSEADLSRGDILALLEAPEYLGGVALASAFLDYCDQRAGLLIGRGGDDDGHKPRTYTFPHRTFQEYLAGCHMVRGRTREIIPEYRTRAEEGDLWALAAQLGSEELLYNKSRPGDVLDLAYALCPDREARGESEWREVLWAGQIIAMLGIDAVSRDLENAGGASTYLERLLGRLVQILEQGRLGAVERAEAGRVLARMGDPRPGVGLRDDGLPDIAWCDVVAGQFIMGSAKELAMYDDETPQRRVELPAYRISHYPVTNAQYAAFVRDGGYTEKWRGCWSEDGWKWKGERTAPDAYGGVFDLSNHPIVNVTWYEAVAFCAWLTEQLHKNRDIGPDHVVRLPRESEWEKGARGTDGRIYPWEGKIDPNRANYDETGINATSAVGCFPDGVSRCGALDMSGNAWEWCATRWQESYEGYRDELGFEGNDTRVRRGGSFTNVEDGVSCAIRLMSSPGLRTRYIGFRIVLSPI
jgi:formylglycine-generating enzyme required for sulfatase activity